MKDNLLKLERKKAVEVELLAKEQIRKANYFAREREREQAEKAKATKRAEKYANDRIKDLAREKARKESYLAREKALAEAHEARKLKEK